MTRLSRLGPAEAGGLGGVGPLRALTPAFFIADIRV